MDAQFIFFSIMICVFMLISECIVVAKVSKRFLSKNLISIIHLLSLIAILCFLLGYSIAGDRYADWELGVSVDKYLAFSFVIGLLSVVTYSHRKHLIIGVAISMFSIIYSFYLNSIFIKEVFL